MEKFECTRDNLDDGISMFESCKNETWDRTGVGWAEFLLGAHQKKKVSIPVRMGVQLDMRETQVSDFVGM